MKRLILAAAMLAALVASHQPLSAGWCVEQCGLTRQPPPPPPPPPSTSACVSYYRGSVLVTECIGQ
jgi:hypothetical protein